MSDRIITPAELCRIMDRAVAAYMLDKRHAEMAAEQARKSARQ